MKHFRIFFAIFGLLVGLVIVSAQESSVELEAFVDEELGIEGVAPHSWEMMGAGQFVMDDLTFIWIKQFASYDILTRSFPAEVGLSEMPEAEETVETDFATWDIFTTEEPRFDIKVIVATGEHDGAGYAFILQTTTDQADDLRAEVFDPMLASIMAIGANATSGVELEPFVYEDLGVQGVVPVGWESPAAGRYIFDDLTFIWLKQFPSYRMLTTSFPPELGLQELPEAEETLETEFATWDIFTTEEPRFDIKVIVAVGEHDGAGYAFILQTTTDQADSLRAEVFDPVLASLMPIGADAASSVELEAFVAEDLGVQGFVPVDWEMMGAGQYVMDDLTFIWIKQFASYDILTRTFPAEVGLSEMPEAEATIETEFATWDIFTTEEPRFDIKIIVATCEHDGMGYAFILQTTMDEVEALRTDVFDPVLESLIPIDKDA